MSIQHVLTLGIMPFICLVSSPSPTLKKSPSRKFCKVSVKKEILSERNVPCFGSLSPLAKEVEFHSRDFISSLNCFAILSSAGIGV